MPRTSWWGVLGWAAYLACSWTWCIGMFLPVLLVRDHGIWGFVVFAVPNVIGAGAMGWVLRDGAAERILAKHSIAVRAFSTITIAFQLWFFEMLLFGGMPYADGTSVTSVRYLAPFLLVLTLVGAAGWSKSRFLNAPLVLGCSILLLANAARFGLPSVPPVVGSPTPGLIFLAPVCMFGFALCPYLDVTFIRTRTSLRSNDARSAFSIGFGVFFFAMILGTLGYAGLLLTSGRGNGEPNWPMYFVALHIIAQLGFTILAHARAVRAAGDVLGVWIGVIIAFGLAMLAVVLTGKAAAGGVSTLTGAEITYRLFMSFYGLLIPAYVWLCMIPTADGHSGIEGGRGRRKLIVFGGACLLAAPCYWMGFIEREEWWLGPGLGVVLLARLLVRSRPVVSDRPSPT